MENAANAVDAECMGYHVGLTAHDVSDMDRLAHLALNPRSGTSREEIYLAVASLYRIQSAELNDSERDLMRDILRRLTRDVEMAIRIALAQRLADDASAPHDLILLLVDDTIEVARPLIINSPLLTDGDMLRLITHADIAHQEAVARRPYISTSVTAALAASQSKSVLLALVRNATARISETTYETLVEKSRALTGLQEALVQRPDLPPQLAGRMCEWVSDALKSYILTNYRMTAENVDAAVSDVQAVLHGDPAAPPGPTSDSAKKLIEKLAISGQLKAGFLIRVLNQGQMDLFDLGFSRLLNVDLAGFRATFYDGGARRVALACRAAGIDRSVFATVFNLSRQAHGMPTALSVPDVILADTIFNTFTRNAAADELHVTLAS